jgi:RNA recognition motif-containing protein
MNKLFVGNLPYEVTSEELGEYFAQFGPIEEAVVITDRFNGRSKGYGFVRFVNDVDANKAEQDINGKEYKGRALVVRRAAPGKRDNAPGIGY